MFGPVIQLFGSLVLKNSYETKIDLVWIVGLIQNPRFNLELVLVYKFIELNIYRIKYYQIYALKV